MPFEDNGQYFTEYHAVKPGEAPISGIRFMVKEKLHHEKTPFQEIDIIDTAYFGKVMLIDGLVMLTEKDNFFYHEMMSHVALFTHKSPKRVAIIGGGDCGTLREVLKHPEVAKATQIEIDERVTRVAEDFFPELCEANDDPRAELLFEDGIAWMANQEPESLDVIIVDSTDPVGPAEGLFQKAFYESCYQALAKDGLLVQQTESPLYQEELIVETVQEMKKGGFKVAAPMPFPQTTYPSGYWSLTLAGKGFNIPDFRRLDAINKIFETKYYNAAIHDGAKALPEFLLKRL